MREELMEIKVIKWDEISTIKALWEGLNAHQHLVSTNFKTFYESFTFEKRIETLKKRDQLIIYVSYERDEPIGYCIASIDDMVGEIDSIYIQEQYRQKGIASELIQHALKWLDSQECETIQVSIAQGNESAFNFYKKFNFVERITLMQRTA